MRPESPCPLRQEALLGVVRAVLRPLVRLLLGHGVRVQQVTEVLKGLYVEVAAEDEAGRRRNVSQISISTGIHRKDVNRLLGADGETPPRGPMPEAQLFTRWVGDPALLGEDGSPRVLPRQSAVPGAPSFDALAREVTTDVHPRALLEEMLRLDLVELQGNDRVRLKVDAFVPRPEHEQMLRFLGDSVHDHMAAAVANVMGREPPRLEQSVFGANLSPASIEALHATARREWAKLLKRVAQQAIAAEQADRGRDDARARFRLGLYFHHETPSDRPPVDADPYRFPRPVRDDAPDAGDDA